MEVHGCTKDDHQSCLRHDLVDHSGVGLHLELTVLVDAHEPREEGLTSDSVVGELQEAIVNGLVAKLVADVSHFNAWQWLMGVHVPDLDDEWLDTIVILLCNAPGEDNSVCGVEAEGAWPEFTRLKSWGVDHELIGLLVERGSGLQTRHVRAVTKLGLGVASNDVPVVGLLQVLLLLFFAAKEGD